METLTAHRVEHPADYRKDARLIGDLTFSQVAWSTLAVIGGGVMELYLNVTGASTGLQMLCGALTIVAVLQITWGLVRRINLVILYGMRPRSRLADASQPVTQVSDHTVQDLVKVQACEGPVVAFLNGNLAMIVRIEPGPTCCLMPEQMDRLCRSLHRALLGLAEARVEITTHVDLVADLNRPEVDRQMGLLNQWPEASGLRLSLGARLEYHSQLARGTARRSVYHLQLTLAPGQLLQVGHEEGPAARNARATEHLRRAARMVADELGSEGVRVLQLTPEAIRDLAARQLDPAGWLRSEPADAPAWRHPFGGLLHSLALYESPTEPATQPIRTAAPGVQPAGVATAIVVQPDVTLLTSQAHTTRMSPHGYPIAYSPRRLACRIPMGKGVYR